MDVQYRLALKPILYHNEFRRLAVCRKQDDGKQACNQGIGKGFEVLMEFAMHCTHTGYYQLRATCVAGRIRRVRNMRVAGRGLWIVIYFR